MSSKKYEINMTEGKLLSKILWFAVPVILSGLLQTFYSVADMIIVGKYIGDGSLAAIGSTSSLILLITHLFTGLSHGSTIIVSKYYGAKDNDRMQKASSTAVVLSIIGGISLALFGFFFSGILIKLTGVPDDIFALAHAYVRTYFLSMPAMMLYNFSSGIMRAYGDTKRPLYFVFIAGILNVFLNILFIAVFKMGIEGAAYGTVVSQIVSAGLTIRCLHKSDNACRIDFKKLTFHKEEFFNILRYGLPVGIQSTLFSISSVLMQTAINSFGTTVIAAHGAVTYIGNVLGNVNSGFSSAASTCAAQNYGAKNKTHLIRGMWICLAAITASEFILGIASNIFGTSIMSIVTDSTETISAGLIRIKYVMSFYFISGFVSVINGSLRGIGHTLSPTIVSISGNCIARALWIYTIFRIFPTITCLYISFPVIWTLEAIVQSVMFIIFCKRLKFQE